MSSKKERIVYAQGHGYMIKQECTYMNSTWKFLHGHEVGKLTIWSEQKWKNKCYPCPCHYLLSTIDLKLSLM